MYGSQAMLNFMGIELSRTSVLDATTLMGFHHLLEADDLTKAMLVKVNVMLMERWLLMTQGTLVAATLSAAPSSTKKKTLHAIQKCTKPGTATNGTFVPRRTLA